MYVITEANPKLVISAYYDLVGRPTLPPMWALGWNQCRWGYHNTNELRKVVQGYADNNIPLETQWSDIDYMFAYRDFTFDHKNFEDLP